MESTYLAEAVRQASLLYIPDVGAGHRRCLGLNRQVRRGLELSDVVGDGRGVRLLDGLGLVVDRGGDVGLDDRRGLDDRHGVGHGAERSDGVGHDLGLDRREHLRLGLRLGLLDGLGLKGSVSRRISKPR